MKKIYTLILLCSLVKIGNAQLTLTKAANEPVIGDVERRKSFDTTSTCPQSTGANQVWNFTTLATNTNSMVSNTYTTPSTLPGGGSYASATIGSTDGGTTQSFFKSTATQYELLGMKINTLSITFTNSAVMAVWPITSAYTNTDNIGGSIAVGSLSGTFSGNIVTSAPGSGTIQLPSGVTLSNILQVKSRQTLNGSFLFGFVTATINITSFQYYHSSQKFPVLTHNITSVTTATASYNSTVTAVNINNDVFVGVNEITNSITSLNIYPNPTTNQFNVNLKNENSEEISVHILNNLGQIVKTADLGNSKGEINTTVDVSDLNSGLYMVKTTVGKASTVKKLIIR